MAADVIQFRERRRQAGEAQVEALSYIDESATIAARIRYLLARGELANAHRLARTLEDRATAARSEIVGLTGGAA
jgi:CHASE3 domain sensor protein